MGQFRLRCLDSLAALRAEEKPWDALWEQCETALPTSRAELLAQWVECFAPRKAFRAMVVESDGCFVAAMPLVEGRIAKVFRIGTLPDNEWSPAGDLLLDAQADSQAALDLLIAGLQSGRWPLLRVHAANLQSQRWQAFCTALARAGHAMQSKAVMQVGLIEIGDDWQQYVASRSRNHRHYLRKAASRATKEGGVELQVFDNLRPDAVANYLQRGFAVEHQGWKGRAGTSVISSPHVFDFYHRQAEYLASQGMLELCYLQHQGRDIAFEYGWRSKGVYFTPKVGYDESSERLSPGQLLRFRQLERLFKDSPAQRVDYLGPLSEATSKWCTASYTISSLVVALQSPLGRPLLDACCRFKPWLAGRRDASATGSQRWTPGVPQREPPIEKPATTSLAAFASDA